MINVNKPFDAGSVRCYIQEEPWGFVTRMFLSTGTHAITFNNGEIIMSLLEEGVMARPDQAALSWSSPWEAQVIDIFKAIGKALDLYNDDPGLSYKQGHAEGESQVLREWNADLRHPMLIMESPSARH